MPIDYYFIRHGMVAPELIQSSLGYGSMQPLLHEEWIRNPAYDIYPSTNGFHEYPFKSVSGKQEKGYFDNEYISSLESNLYKLATLGNIIAPRFSQHMRVITADDPRTVDTAIIIASSMWNINGKFTQQKQTEVLNLQNRLSELELKRWKQEIGEGQEEQNEIRDYLCMEMQIIRDIRLNEIIEKDKVKSVERLNTILALSPNRMVIDRLHGLLNEVKEADTLRDENNTNEERLKSTYFISHGNTLRILIALILHNNDPETQFPSYRKIKSEFKKCFSLGRGEGVKFLMDNAYNLKAYRNLPDGRLFFYPETASRRTKEGSY